MRTLPSAVAVIASIALLQGCTLTSNVDSYDSRTVEVAWSQPDALLSDVQVVGDTAIAYVARLHGDVALVARDTNSGAELWRHDAHPGINPRGTPFTVATLPLRGSRWAVAYLQSTPDWIAKSTLVVVDARTGEKLLASAEPAYTTRPAACGIRFCAESQADASSDLTAMTIDVDGAEPATEVPIDRARPYMEGGWMVGTYTSVYTDESGKQSIRFGADGRLLWSRSYEEVFGEGTTSENGWWFSDEDPTLPVIGQSYGVYEEDANRSMRTHSLPTERTVALDRSTGSTIWSVAGSMCNAADTIRALGGDSLVLCRYRSGTVERSTADVNAPPTWRNLDVELIAVDLTSGKIRWTVPLGNEQSNVAWAREGGPPLFRVGATPLVVIKGRAVRVEPDTGSTHPLAADRVLLCEEPRRYADLRSMWVDESLAAYPLARGWSACLPDGSPVAQQGLTGGALNLAGFETEEPIVVGSPEGMTAYRVAGDSDPS